MVLQNYQNFTKMTSNMIYIIALGGGFKCPRKIHLNYCIVKDSSVDLGVISRTLQNIPNCFHKLHLRLRVGKWSEKRVVYYIKTAN